MITVWQWLIIIISLIVIIWAIFWGNRFVQKDFGWGTWLPEEIGPCVNQSGACDQPATRTIRQVCEPNLLTKRGCIDYNGYPTYAVRIKKESCALQCRSSKWKVEIKECIHPEPCIPTATGGVIGNQEVIYTCIPFDSTGMNTCVTGGLIPFQSGQYQNITIYQPGDVVEFNLPCYSKCTDEPIPEPKLETYQTDWIYHIPHCVASDVLREGHLPNSERLCRLIPSNSAHYFKTRMGYLIGLQTPHIKSTLSKFQDWGYGTDQKLVDTPLTYGEQPDFEVIMVIASRTPLHAQVGLFLAGKYWGWLIVKNSRPYWTQAKVKIEGPGLLSEEVPLIRYDKMGDNEIIFPDVIVPSSLGWLQKGHENENILMRGKLESI